MQPFDDASILNGLSYRDATSLRRVMRAVMSRFGGQSSEIAARDHQLNGVEREVVDQIMDETVDNELFYRAAIRFGSANAANSATILRSGQELSSIFSPSVLGPRHLRVEDDVEIARVAYQDLLDNGTPFVYGLEEDFAEGSDGDEEYESGAESDPVRAKKNGKRPAGPHPNKPGKKKHKPIRGKDERAIDDDTIDRKVRAKLNEPDPSLLVITLPAEKKDPKNKDNWLPKSPIIYDYNKIDPSFDWTSKKMVSRLNAWRNQHFNRNFGPERESRYQYTAAERDLIFKLVREFLATVEWRYSKIDWQAIADEFNKQMAGRWFGKSDDTADSHYTYDSKRKITVSRKVEVPHEFEPRKPTGLQNQLEHFEHAMAEHILKKARDADLQYVLSLLPKIDVDGASKQPSANEGSDDEENGEKGKGKAKDTSAEEPSPSIPAVEPVVQQQPDADLGLMAAIEDSIADAREDERKRKTGGESSKRGGGPSNKK